MKPVVATLVLLFGIGWFTASVESPKAAAAPAVNIDYGPDSWRRTANGWEDAKTWRRVETPRVDFRPIHPTIVAAFTFLACVGGLIAYCPSWSSNVCPRYNE